RPSSMSACFTHDRRLFSPCQECPLGNDRFYLWKTEQSITSAQDASAICSTSEFMYIDFEERYEVALDTGTYLACSRNMDYQNAMNCVDVLIAEGMITTLNTEHMGWTPALYLSEPGEAPVLIDNPILATCIRQ
ncbi:MAG TPA: hypothetical protein PKH54_08985, partial [Myxococcota bacterium]|nr:hypothetical protein [Myxococcota bacterium]HOD00070.1 hypothetical protein [Myxococcota bacterium]HOH77068.1 hypothetical protein [Myxococcota bacterium]